MKWSVWISFKISVHGNHEDSSEGWSTSVRRRSQYDLYFSWGAWYPSSQKQNLQSMFKKIWLYIFCICFRKLPKHNINSFSHISDNVSDLINVSTVERENGSCQCFLGIFLLIFYFFLFIFVESLWELQSGYDQVSSIQFCNTHTSTSTHFSPPKSSVLLLFPLPFTLATEDLCLAGLLIFFLVHDLIFQCDKWEVQGLNKKLFFLKLANMIGIPTVVLCSLKVGSSPSWPRLDQIISWTFPALGPGSVP